MTTQSWFLLAALVAGCARTPRENVDPSITADSLCGIVRVVGSEPMVMVEMELASGSTERLSGEPTRTLRQLSGLGVCVLADRERTVRSFVIRSQGGEPAIDGTLVERAGTFVIRAPDGTETGLTTVPEDLRREAGARVWVVLDSAGRVKSFGVVR